MVLHYGVKRDVGPFLQWLRKVFRGRDWTTEQLRSQNLISPRPYPAANPPQGPNDKISNNYYYTRDARRDHDPPVDLTTQQIKQIAAGDQTSSSSSLTKAFVAPVPGKVYDYSKKSEEVHHNRWF